MPITSELIELAVKHGGEENCVLKACLLDRITLEQLSNAVDVCAASCELDNNAKELCAKGVAATDSIGQRRVRRRIADIAIGLLALDLPVLVVLSIVELDLFGVRRKQFLPSPTVMWDLLQRVKHWDGSQEPK